MFTITNKVGYYKAWITILFDRKCFVDPSIKGAGLNTTVSVSKLNMQTVELDVKKQHENTRARMVHSIRTDGSYKCLKKKKKKLRDLVLRLRARSLLGDLTQFIVCERKQISSISFTCRAFLRMRGTASTFFKIEVNRCRDFIRCSQAGYSTSTKAQSRGTMLESAFIEHVYCYWVTNYFPLWVNGQK